MRVRKRHWLVVLSQHFCQIMLQRGQCCADSRRSKSVSDCARIKLCEDFEEGFVPELRERLLNTLIKNWSRFCVADRRAVLRQKILQFFHDVSEKLVRILNRAVSYAVIRGFSRKLSVNQKFYISFDSKEYFA